MKTICRLGDFIVPNVSLYLYPDATSITVEADRTVVGPLDKPYLIIMDCDSSNCVLYEGVPDPTDWFGWKYTYTEADGWQLNPQWVDPRTQS